MALPTPDTTPRIFQHIGDVSELEGGMIGIDDAVDADIGDKRLVYQDEDDVEHVVLNKDEDARVADLDITGTLQGGDVVKNNLTATASPTISNDSTEGYSVGSIWVYAGASEYKICQDNSAGAAVWEALNDGGVPASHGASHGAGQSDEINVAGLSGVLADAQNADKLQGNDFAAGVPNDGDISKWIGGATEAWTPVDPRTLNKVTIDLLTGDDATTTFDVDTPENILVTGGSNNHTLDLGDATTYAVGKKFNVSNATSEVMPVENGDKTAWKLLQRLHTLTAELLDNSTAAGVWKITIVEPDKRCLQQFFDDFLQRESFAPVGWRVVNSGGSSVLTGVTGSAADDNKLSYAKWQTGATANAFSIIQNIPVIFGGGSNNFPTYCAILLKNPVLSVVTNEYFYRMGTGDSAAVAADIDGVFFGYDRATDGNFYTLNTASNSTPTKVVTSIVPIASTHVFFEFVVASDASRVDFWIDKVHAGKITTNIPVGATRRTAAQLGFFKTGASSGSLSPAVDFYEITRVIDRLV